MILLAAAGDAVHATARQVGVWPKVVRRWRARWLSVPAATSIAARLADAPRRGTPATFTPEQICAIMALACEPPEKSNLPLSHWSQSELAGEAVRRGIVQKISHGSVGRFLKEADLKPHRVRNWPTPKPDPEFETKCADVCTVYHDAAATQQGVRTVAAGEMTGVPALERTAPDLPMRRGDVVRREFESVRHGTQTLIAAFDVATGRVIGVVGDTRTEQDYASFLQSLFATSASSTGWRVVCDNLNTHLSQSVVRLLARLCRIEDDLGEKGKSDVLTSMVSREAFLRDRSHRFCFHFTPKHASWLNQVEILVLDPRAQAAAACQLRVQAGPRGADRALHRLRQPDSCQAVSLDQDRQASGGVKQAGMGSSLPTGCTSAGRGGFGRRIIWPGYPPHRVHRRRSKDPYALLVRGRHPPEGRCAASCHMAARWGHRPPQRAGHLTPMVPAKGCGERAIWPPPHFQQTYSLLASKHAGWRATRLAA